MQLVEEVKTDLRQLIEEGEKPEGNQVSKKIYQKLDEWMKNYLRDTLKKHHEWMILKMLDCRWYDWVYDWVYDSVYEL